MVECLDREQANVPKLVLVVDGDDSAREGIAAAFAGTEIEARTAASGSAALDEIRRQCPDLVITDLVLPDITGVALCKKLREDAQIPPLRLMVLTQYREEMDRVIAFEAGADDFVSKPYSAAELLARSRAILRRPARRSDGAKLHPWASGAAAGEQSWSEFGRFPGLNDATQRERQIFSELMRQRGRVVSRDELLRLWPTASRCTPRTVDAHIKSLRRKLGQDRDCIRTVRGIGYRYDPPTTRSAARS